TYRRQTGPCLGRVVVVVVVVPGSVGGSDAGTVVVVVLGTVVVLDFSPGAGGVTPHRCLVQSGRRTTMSRVAFALASFPEIATSGTEPNGIERMIRRPTLPLSSASFRRSCRCGDVRTQMPSCAFRRDVVCSTAAPADRTTRTP